MERKKAAEISRSTRSTGMGAYSDSCLYSIKQEKELAPHKSRSSRTGNHGTKTWHLFPGRYWEARISRSNSGKGGWSVSILRINEDLTESHEVATIPEWLKPLLPKSALQEVEPVPYE